MITTKYWQERMRDAQDEQATKTIEETQKQIQAYYSKAMRRIIAEFEATYDKLLNTAKDGKPPTVADLYKLDKYWQLQGQLQAELQKMGDKETVLFAKQFEKTFQSVYNSLALPSQKQFSQMSKENVKQMISQIWCADGKSWSQRVWNDTERLQQSLNDRLIDCVITGKKTTQLNKFLQEEFNVSYNRADTIIRTEIAHIQTQAARQRYKDYGIREVEIYADTDNRSCPICSQLNGKRYRVDDALPIPAHPRCRCCVVPVVEQPNAAIENEQAFTKKDGLPSSSSSDRIAPEWANGRFMDKKAENNHKKHLKEYNNISFDEYVRGARVLLSKPIGGNIDGFENNADAIYRYDIVNNDFVIGKEGVIITRFKPINGKVYWEVIKASELGQK
jgi:SPP1 gp7 family putative phage head morphogenesis protein